MNECRERCRASVHNPTVETFDGSGALLERYAYRDLVLDPGLGEADFKL